jgi:hypothetical protein
MFAELEKVPDFDPEAQMRLCVFTIVHGELVCVESPF